MSLYLGIPDEEWRLLLSEAEELLVEAEIGVHLLAAYPCGSRIYGDESGAPSLFCLYMDDPASLLDPCHLDKGIVSLGIGRGCGPACFMSLHAWAKRTCEYTQIDSSFDRNLFPLIPPLSVPLYEDHNVTTIMDLARNFLGTKGWTRPVFSRQREAISYVSYLRTLLVLYHLDIFSPCINVSWCKDVILLKDHWLREPGLIQSLDRKLISFLSGEEEKPSDEELASLAKWLELSILAVQPTETDALKEKESLGKAVCHLYRSLL